MDIKSSSFLHMKLWGTTALCFMFVLQTWVCAWITYTGDQPHDLVRQRTPSWILYREPRKTWMDIILLCVCNITYSQNDLSFLASGLLCPQLQCCHRSRETIPLLLHVSSPPPQFHPVREIHWIRWEQHVRGNRDRRSWSLTNERGAQVHSCKTRLSDGKMLILECGRTPLPLAQVSRK